MDISPHKTDRQPTRWTHGQLSVIDALLQNEPHLNLVFLHPTVLNRTFLFADDITGKILLGICQVRAKLEPNGQIWRARAFTGEKMREDSRFRVNEKEV